MIHVCYALYDKTGKYSRLTGTSICSLFENTKAWVTIHLLHDNTLTEENREKFIQLARKYGNHIVFYNMDKFCKTNELIRGQLDAAREQSFSVRFSQAALYRLLAMHVLPKDVHRLIYLDSDTIVHCDIHDLWMEEVGENGFAAVPEYKMLGGHVGNTSKYLCDDGLVDEKAYFNSGVLLIDMEAYRQHPDLLKEGMVFLSEHPSYQCFDQDILNYVFAGQSHPLNERYNMAVEMMRKIPLGGICFYLPLSGTAIQHVGHHGCIRAADESLLSADAVV